MQLPTRGGHGRGWSRRRGRGRVTIQPAQSSANVSDSGPRNKQHDDNEFDRQQTPICGAVYDGVETPKTPVCGQVDDGCAGSPEAVLWSQSWTIELKSYCDEDANEYAVRPRVRVPGQNLKEPRLPSSAENVDASKDRARASSSSSSTRFSEEFFDAVEHQPASAPPESSMPSLQRQLSIPN